jgi:heme A synthase
LSNSQILLTVLLSTVLIVLAVVYGWRQLRLLRELSWTDHASEEDRRYHERQGWRRLFNSGLLVILAALLAGSLFIENRAQQLADERAAARARDPEAPLEGEQRQFVNFYAGYWIAILLVLLLVIGVALVDLMAIRSYGRRHYREIQADRRAMIEQEVANLRQQRNGQS